MTTPLLHSKREYLQLLVHEKNRNSRTLTDEERSAGFLGWHERGVLPHCDFPGLIQLVTIRLADSMPSSRRREWEHLLQVEDLCERRTKLEDYLDRGHGECCLRNPRIARLAEETLLHFHQVRYDLLAWCVMPNHVHILVHVWQTPLWKLIRSWKQYIATHAVPSERRPPARHEAMVANALPPGRRPALRWQREYWDTYMRDEKQERTAIRYIERNPAEARLCRTPEQWPCSSARFRDKYRRLFAP
jgi:putative transposase